MITVDEDDLVELVRSKSSSEYEIFHAKLFRYSLARLLPESYT